MLQESRNDNIMFTVTEMPHAGPEQFLPRLCYQYENREVLGDDPKKVSYITLATKTSSPQSTSII